MKTFYYLNNRKLDIQVTEQTLEITPYTFMANGNMWEQASVRQFYDCINDVSCNIIDIGAQSGLYSLYAKFLPNTTFYSFEPFLDTYNLLNDNLKLNNITNVNTYNIGISNTKGITKLNTCIKHNGLHTMGEKPLRFSDIKSVEINTDTLDNLFYNKNIPVHFIKIDTEGWEYYILKGGELTIKKYKPIIQLEYNKTNMKQCNVTEIMLNNLLEDYGYYEKSMAQEEKLFCPIIN